MARKPGVVLTENAYDEQPVIQPPSSATVDFNRPPLLYLPDGRVLVQRIGFRT